MDVYPRYFIKQSKEIAWFINWFTKDRSDNTKGIIILIEESIGIND